MKFARTATFPGLIALLAMLLTATATTPIYAQEEQQLHGVIVHGGEADEFDPAGITVSLEEFQDATFLDQATTETDAEGNFSFDVSPGSERSYFISAEYQGARYSATRNPTNIGEPITLEVFEATQDPDVISVETHTIIVTGAVREDQFIEVLERVTVRNDSGMTLVPDLDTGDPAMLSFLRFGMPTGYYNLDVGATLVGGQLLEVDKGFALDMPVLPTGDEPHQFEFVYRVPYESPELDLSRTIRFGAESLAVVTPVDVGRPTSPGMEDLGAAEFEGRLMRFLIDRDVPRDSTLDLTIAELPMPSLWTTLARNSGEWYLRIGAPSLLALAALGLLAVAMRRRATVQLAPDATPEARQKALWAKARELELRLHSGDVSQSRYETEREHLRRALLELEIGQRVRLD